MRISDIKINCEAQTEIDGSPEWVETEADITVNGGYNPNVVLEFYANDKFQATRIPADEIIALAELVKAQLR
ncbi:hypothetical protein [Nocardia flavorosea]|uniref:Uncharacterized protein n=1 Tax=Nocardia flavorosea TaxID=53429 RepID=A0A846YTV4_9NOCA|nr:hypothetical protein [Nocardia flavorosea]NKY60409.1 hypothetical protein [Nocardia flavorosea]